MFFSIKKLYNLWFCWGGEIVPRSHQFMSVAIEIDCEIENPALAGVDTFIICWGGETGRHVRFRCVCRKTWGFESLPQHFFVNEIYYFDCEFSSIWGASPPNPRPNFSHNRARKIWKKEPFPLACQFQQVTFWVSFKYIEYEAHSHRLVRRRMNKYLQTDLNSLQVKLHELYLRQIKRFWLKLFWMKIVWFCE